MGTVLKDKNRPAVWFFIVANALAFILVMTPEPRQMLPSLVEQGGWRLPIGGVGLVFASMLGWLLSPTMKARLVFFRWSNPLPGSRAFSVLMKGDSRIDQSRLRSRHGGRLPSAPAEQNRLWYRWFKEVDELPAVAQTHRAFLLLRDCTAMAGLAVCVLAPLAAYWLGPGPRLYTYLCGLALEFALFRLAASNAGNRLVTTALAEFATKAAPTTESSRP